MVGGVIKLPHRFYSSERLIGLSLVSHYHLVTSDFLIATWPSTGMTVNCFCKTKLGHSWILCRNDSSVSPVMRSLGNFIGIYLPVLLVCGGWVGHCF